MAENIQFNRALAEEFRRELSSLMYVFYENGTTYYNCSFCQRFCYPAPPGATLLNRINHAPDCLGERLMKELDSQLNLD